jgi:putative ABC transport system permease protein
MRPILGGTTNMAIATEEQFGDDDAVHLADWRQITPGYFETMGIPLLRGRLFTDQDKLEAPGVAIISEALAERMWPGEDPIGRRAIFWLNPDFNGEIIGVVGNMRERGLDNDPTMAVYLPYNERGWTPVHFVAHTRTEPHSLLPELRAFLGQIDSKLPISRVRTLEELIGDNLSARRFNALLMSVFACVALLLALAGIYGVLAYAVSRRTSEIGIRVALGASPEKVLRLVVAQGMRPALAGIVLGLLGALWLARLLESLLYEVATSDLVTYVAVAAVFVIATVLSCYLPARRALRVDPVEALRQE